MYWKKFSADIRISRISAKSLDMAKIQLCANIFGWYLD